MMSRAREEESTLLLQADHTQATGKQGDFHVGDGAICNLDAGILKNNYPSATGWGEAGEEKRSQYPSTPFHSGASSIYFILGNMAQGSGEN